LALAVAIGNVEIVKLLL